MANPYSELAVTQTTLAQRPPPWGCRRLAYETRPSRGPERTTSTQDKDLLDQDSLFAHFFKKQKEAGSSAREAFARILADLAPADQRVLPYLVACLSDKEVRVRLRALEGLVSVGPGASIALPPLLELLGEYVPGQTPLVLMCLREIGSRAACASPRVQKLLATSQDPDTKVFAMQALMAMNPRDEKSIDMICDVVRTERDPDVRSHAYRALGKCRGRHEKVLAVLGKGLAEAYDGARVAAAEAVGGLGPRGRPLTAQMLKAVRDKNRYVRATVAKGLGQLEADSDTVIASLSDALEDKDRDVRVEAATALGMLGYKSGPVLRKSLLKGRVEVRAYAARQLGMPQLRSPESLEALRKALKDEWWTVRRLAIQSIARYGASARVATEDLKARLSDEDKEVQKEALEALRRVLRLDD